MSSAPPPDHPDSPVSDGDIYEAHPDDEDTGPLHVEMPAQSVHWDRGVSAADDWGPRPGQSGWAVRFDAPLTVNPRQVPRRRNRKVLVYAAGGVVAVSVVAGVLLMRPSSDNPRAQSEDPQTSAEQRPPTPSADEHRLLRMLPRGYPADSCEPAAGSKSNEVLAQVNCVVNSDAGGPQSATYTLASDKAALQEAFNDVVKSAEQVNCPRNIQSPGPWRRNATPQTVAGTLFCGLQGGNPTVAWTDDARLMLSVAHAGPSGPTFPELYAWWASHS